MEFRKKIKPLLLGFCILLTNSHASSLTLGHNGSFEKKTKCTDSYRPNYSRYSWHWVNHVSFDGMEAMLEDGSHWEVNSWEKNILLSWNYEDALLIMQNDAWCSSYDYIIYNKTKNSSVTCNLTLSPIIGGQYTHHIQSINYGNAEIILEDGTRWLLQKDDEYYYKDWLRNDLVIIGVNKSDWEAYANILINVNMNNYSRSSQL